MDWSRCREALLKRLFQCNRIKPTADIIIKVTTSARLLLHILPSHLPHISPTSPPYLHHILLHIFPTSRRARSELTSVTPRTSAVNG